MREVEGKTCVSDQREGWVPEGKTIRPTHKKDHAILRSALHFGIACLSFLLVGLNDCLSGTHRFLLLLSVSSRGTLKKTYEETERRRRKQRPWELLLSTHIFLPLFHSLDLCFCLPSLQEKQEIVGNVVAGKMWVISSQGLSSSSFIILFHN